MCLSSDVNETLGIPHNASWKILTDLQTNNYIRVFSNVATQTFYKHL